MAIDPGLVDPCPAEDADPGLPEVPEAVGVTDSCGRGAGRRRRVARTVLPLLIGAAMIVVLLSSSSSLTGAARALRSMDRWWVLAAVGVEAVSYLWLSLHLRLLAGPSGNARRVAPLRLALVVFGLGNVMPAAPAEGLVMAGAALRRRRVDPRRIAVVLGFSQWFSVRALFAVASLDALVAVAIGDVPRPYRGGLLGAAAVTFVLLVFTTWLSLRRQVVENAASVALRVIHWRHCPPASERRARGAAWHAVAVHVAGGRRQRFALTGTTAAAWVCDGLCMYLALRGLRVYLGVDQLLLAYAAGVIASNVPLLPAGLGVVETVTPFILVHYGVPWPQAVAAVLVYRLIGTLLPAVGGLVALCGLRLESAEKAEPDAHPEQPPVPGRIALYAVAGAVGLSAGQLTAEARPGPIPRATLDGPPSSFIA